MKQYQNTLYITTQGTYLSKDGECIAIHHDGNLKGKIPSHTLGGLVLFGRVSCSPFLLGHCAEKGITISWLTENGRFLAAMNGPVTGNVLLRTEQYKQSNDLQRCASIAKSICIGKIYNSRVILQRTARSHPSPILKNACFSLEQSLIQLKNELPLDTIRGIEGKAAQIYFGVFQHLLHDKNSDFIFKSRSRRPPLDEVNCLLSFCYTLLTHDIRGALESVGLDPAVGYLHRLRPGRPALALDLIEEFRAYIADRLVCTLINRGQVKKNQFRKTESGAVIMREDLLKFILQEWQKRKQETIIHPFLNEKMPINLIFHTQARLLAATIRGDYDQYPPFTVR